MNYGPKQASDTSNCHKLQADDFSIENIDQRSILSSENKEKTNQKFPSHANSMKTQQKSWNNSLY